MKEVKVKAFAKVNLSLDITGRREDGYHELRSVMQEIALQDRVVIRTAPSGVSLKVVTENAPGSGHDTVPGDERNLAWKAADLILKDAKVSGGVDITLYKNIPAAAGLGGGSSDAAAVLRGICILYVLDYGIEELCRLGAKLGADIPFCIMGGTALAEGIGDRLSPLPTVRGVHMLLVKPPIEVSTKQVYQDFDAIADRHRPLDTDKLLELLRSEKADVQSLSACLGNALAEVTEAQHPQIAAIREKMQELGAEGALMSGSGPTVFGLFASKEKAEAACVQMRGLYPEAYCAPSSFCEIHKEMKE